MRTETLAEQLFFTTALVTAQDGASSWSGTAFIYTVPTEHGDAPFLVTNRHVLERATTFTVRQVARNDDGTPRIGHATQITVHMGPGDQPWTSHPDDAVDVAVMPFAQIERAMNDMGAPPFYRALNPSLVPTKQDLENLDAIEEVTFVGYPAGISDSVNFTPIARRGTTATPPELDYRGLPAFLIDASVFPGSSGSPVLIVNNGFHGNRGGGIAIGQRVWLLGIVAAVHQRQVQGPVVELPTTHIAVVPETLDLGIVFRAEAIDGCIDVVLASRGVRRIGGDAAA